MLAFRAYVQDLAESLLKYIKTLDSYPVQMNHVGMTVKTRMWKHPYSPQEKTNMLGIIGKGVCLSLFCVD